MLLTVRCRSSRFVLQSTPYMLYSHMKLSVRAHRYFAMIPPQFLESHINIPAILQPTKFGLFVVSFPKAAPRCGPLQGGVSLGAQISSKFSPLHPRLPSVKMSIASPILCNKNRKIQNCSSVIQAIMDAFIY